MQQSDRKKYRAWLVIRLIGVTIKYCAMPYDVKTLAVLQRSHQLDAGEDVKKVYAPDRYGAIQRALGLYGNYNWPTSMPCNGHNFFRDIDDYMVMAIMDAIETSDYNQAAAARLLGISVRKMSYYIKKFGITHPSWRVHREANVVAI